MMKNDLNRDSILRQLLNEDNPLITRNYEISYSCGSWKVIEWTSINSYKRTWFTFYSGAINFIRSFNKKRLNTDYIGKKESRIVPSVDYHNLWQKKAYGEVLN